jgi:hypothetical protein
VTDSNDEVTWRQATSRFRSVEATDFSYLLQELTAQQTTDNALQAQPVEGSLQLRFEPLTGRATPEASARALVNDWCSRVMDGEIVNTAFSTENVFLEVQRAVILGHINPEQVEITFVNGSGRHTIRLDREANLSDTPVGFCDYTDHRLREILGWDKDDQVTIKRHRVDLVVGDTENEYHGITERLTFLVSCTPEELRRFYVTGRLQIGSNVTRILESVGQDTPDITPEQKEAMDSSGFSDFYRGHHTYHPSESESGVTVAMIADIYFFIARVGSQIIQANSQPLTWELTTADVSIPIGAIAATERF